MTPRKRLSLYEEITLLGLRNQKGTASIGYLDYAIGGAVLAELLIEKRIATNDSRKHLVEVTDVRPLDDPLLDASLQNIKAGKRRASLQTWVSRMVGIKKLRHKAAGQLCQRGILRADEKTVLLIFSRKVYPEIDPKPEKELVDRLRHAIFTDDPQVDARTAIVISLAHGTGLLAEKFGRKEIKNRKKRIEQIVKGELIGPAIGNVIAACQAAVMAAVIIPAAVSASN